MEKRTLIALFCVAVIGAGAFLVLHSPQKGQRTEPAPRAFAEIKADQIEELDVTSEKQEHTVLVKKGGGWRIQSAEDWGADPQAAKSLVDGVATMTFGDIATEEAAKHEELGVVDGKAARVIAKGAGHKVLADFYIGKSLGGFTMVRPAGKNEVWQASKVFAYMTNHDTNGWRNHSIFEFPQGDVDKLVVEAGANKLAVEKEAPPANAKPGDATKWKITEATGDAPKTVAALDDQQVNAAVQTLSSLRAADFADGKKAEETGLANPWLKVTAHVKDKDHTLFVGASKGDDVFVRSSDGNTSFALKKYAVDRLAHKPVDYRDKTIVKVKSEDLTGIDIQIGAETTSLSQTGGTWKAKKGAVDENKVKALAGAFENLSGAGFADERDLGKAAGQVVLHLKDGKAATLKIGSENKDGDYRVQRAGAPEIFVVKKFAVDRFLKKPAELTPSKAPPSMPPGMPPGMPPH